MTEKQELNKSYIEVLSGLKARISQARIQATIAVNVHLLSMYWEIGNTILQQQAAEGWGSKVIARLAGDLKSEFPDMKGLSERNLKYMKAFAEEYPGFTIVQAPLAQLQLSDKKSNTILQAPLAQLQMANTQEAPILQAALAKLTWYHHLTLLDRVKDKEVREFYIAETVKNGWSRNVMVHQIESGLHLKQGSITSNFKTTIAPQQSELVQQLFKDPYKFDFIYLGNEAKERDLEDAIVSQVTKFLLELGQHFAYLGRQYRMCIGDKKYFYDLLFYHTRLKRYIVIELKIDDFKPEYKGKMEFYLNIADDYLKQEDDNESIGLILCKTKDGMVAEYALRNSSKPIGIAEYKIMEMLPENIRGELPSIEELEAEMDKEYEELKSPAEKKFDALKQKLAGIRQEEIQGALSFEILSKLYTSGLRPLYEEIIKKLDPIKEIFASNSMVWEARNKSLSQLEDLDELMKDEPYWNLHNELQFTWNFFALKKGGINTFNAGINLSFQMETYRYGFSIDHQRIPLLKRLYHQPLDRETRKYITEILFEYLTENLSENVKRFIPEQNGG